MPSAKGTVINDISIFMRLLFREFCPEKSHNLSASSSQRIKYFLHNPAIPIFCGCVYGERLVLKKDFLWGVATSAFQREGSPDADWASWDAILGAKPKMDARLKTLGMTHKGIKTVSTIMRP